MAGAGSVLDGRLVGDDDGGFGGTGYGVTGVVQDEPTERSKSGWGTSAVEEAASDKMVRILKECMLEEA